MRASQARTYTRRMCLRACFRRLPITDYIAPGLPEHTLIGLTCATNFVAQVSVNGLDEGRESPCRLTARDHSSKSGAQWVGHPRCWVGVGGRLAGVWLVSP